MIDNYPKAYAVYNNNLEVRLKSTSGGIFSLLAEFFLNEKNAVVYGASFDNDLNVIHTRITKVDDISHLRGSKYPQSKMGSSYRDVKNDLINGRTVFFVGTPCQIAGLKMFLNDKYNELLYTMDFICHGVASDLIWNEYIRELGRKKRVTNVVFKSKPYGWKKWYFRAEYEDGTYYHIRGSMNRFMASYLSYANIRPSCFECNFKGLDRNSDFTISDCWGIGEKNKDLNDNNGLSALLLHNERALQIFNIIKNNVTFEEYDPQSLMEGNWTTFRSVPQNPIREEFFKAVGDIGASKALKDFFSPSLKEWVRYYYMRLKGLEK